MQYSVEELKVICEKHIKWLRDEEGGERADLRGADLQDADLQYADLRGADLQYADLRGADLRDADLQYADLRGADLRGADLRGANLRGANLDFSCFPLWCGGSRFRVDPKLAYQLLAHLVSLEIVGADDELTGLLRSAREVAKKSHRASDLGLSDE